MNAAICQINKQMAEKTRGIYVSLKFFLPVIPRTKKNHTIITKYGLIQSDAYRQFEADCLMLIPGELRNIKIDWPVTVTTIFYMPTKRKVDKSNLENAIDDVLVKAGILADDNRDIVASHDGSRVYYRKENPGIEITITKLEGYEQWSNTHLK